MIIPRTEQTGRQQEEDIPAEPQQIHQAEADEEKNSQDGQASRRQTMYDRVMPSRAEEGGEELLPRRRAVSGAGRGRQ